jgi:hypothetical protein
VLPSRDVRAPPRLYGLAPCATPVPAGARCRCGTHLGVGGPCFRFERVPYTVADLFAEERFCGPACARAFILEALEVIEASSAPAVLRDLQEIRVALQYLLTVLAAHEGSGGVRLPPSTRAGSSERQGS